MKQGVGSSTSSTPHLSNHKSHVKKITCGILKHFIENCNDNGFNKLRFTIVDCLNVDGLTAVEISSKRKGSGEEH